MATSRCEGQGTASSVLRAAWMLARLPAERETRPPPKTARLVREWGHWVAEVGRWDGKHGQLEEEGLGSRGWNGGGSSPRSSGSCQEAALGNQGWPQSREHPGTPKPKRSVHQRAQEQRHSPLHAQFPRARTIPVPALEC